MSGASTPSGTITQAEGAGAAPNYIFPFYSGSWCTVANTSQFQQLMYRPLYWFGLGNSVLVQPKLSTGNQPVFSNGNKTVTITMKGWKFADGQVVNAEAVMFFLNMYKAVPTDFCTYTPKLGIPDQVVTAKATSANTVVIHLNAAVNPKWFLYNMLSTITPMPNTWDVTGPHTKANCAGGTYGASSTNVACTNVYNYLNKVGQEPSTFTDSMWKSGVDGPWRLTAFDDLGNATFQANPKYMGPQHAQVEYFKEVAFTTEQAEENQLQAGNIDLGTVDPSILTAPAPAPGKVGPNWGQLAQRYNLVTGEPYGFNYDVFNFGGKSPNAALMAQQYFRQALQMAVDQAAIITDVDKNYATVQDSALPYSTPASLSAPFAQPFPFNLTKAESLLTSNGWTLSGGQLSCTSPGTASGDCGAGITSGQKAALSFEWTSGTPSLDTENNAIVADWGTLGINVTHTEVTFDTIFGQCPEALAPTSTYDICSWGGGWVFAPDYLPTGEPLFLTGASSNYGDYSSATMDSLIKATLAKPIPLTAYAKYTAENAPGLWVPNPTATAEVIKTLHSSIAWFCPLENFTPEYFHY
ncbi:MAG: ABC transporter substrate-binding protein [Acidimicrobiales bacterium]